jgi:hypothetical protein
MQQFVQAFACQLLHVYALSKVILREGDYLVPVVEEAEGEGAYAGVDAESDFERMGIRMGSLLSGRGKRDNNYFAEWKMSSSVVSSRPEKSALTCQ